MPRRKVEKKKVQFAVRLWPDDLERLRNAAEFLRIAIQEIAERAILGELQRLEASNEGRPFPPIEKVIESFKPPILDRVRDVDATKAAERPRRSKGVASRPASEPVEDRRTE